MMIQAVAFVMVSAAVFAAGASGAGRVKLGGVGRVEPSAAVVCGMDAVAAKSAPVVFTVPPVLPVSSAASNVTELAAQVYAALSSSAPLCAADVSLVALGLAVVVSPVRVAAPVIAAVGTRTVIVTYEYVFVVDDLDLILPEMAGKRAASDTYFGIRAKRIVDLARAGRMDDARAEAVRYAADWGAYRHKVSDRK